MAASSGNSRYHPLLPKISSHVPTVSPQDEQQKPSRMKAACEACRRHKSKCSGERPQCQACIHRQRKCLYAPTKRKKQLYMLQRENSTLQSRSSSYERLVQAMKSMNEEDARDVLMRLRSGADVETLINHITSGDLLLQLAVVPESRYRYQFPYNKRMPVSLVTDDNPYLRSPMYEAAHMLSPLTQSGLAKNLLQHGNLESLPNVDSHSQGGKPTVDETPYLMPFHAAKVVDTRLSSAILSHWTSVSDQDELMRSILAGWLQCEYQFTAAFQKDLFLEDMEALREDFCSSLLVNVILGYACVCNPLLAKRAEYWNPQTMTYRFIAEAKRLWELEAHKPRITTIQAGLLFNVFYNLCGLDEVGQAYRIHAITLAQSMNLFKPTQKVPPRMQHGIAFTAWAVYNWESLVGFSFLFNPILHDPPEWKLPDASKYPNWYGEIWTKYPTSDRVFPSYFGQVFEARSRFRIIMNEVCQTAFSQDTEMTAEKANAYLTRLENWYNTLPTVLLPRSIMLPGHLQLHIYYYHLILTILRPLLSTETSQIPFHHQVVANATKYLHTLVRIYFLRHGFEAMDLFIVIPLILLASDSLEAMNIPTFELELETIRSTLILVTMGLSFQCRNHYLAKALFCVVRGRMRPSQIALCKSAIDMSAGITSERVDLTQAVRSQWPISIVQEKNEVDSYILTNLVENYASVNLEEESSE